MDYSTKTLNLSCIIIQKEVIDMGNIIKINMYVEMKKKKNNDLRLKVLEENIGKYNSWLKRNNREDKIENYEKFLRAE